MNLKCLTCALVAGLAMSAVATANPGLKQAGGIGVQSNGPAIAGDIVTLPKGSVPGRAIFRAATRTMEIISQPTTVPADDVVLRGPLPSLIWDATAGYAHWQVLNSPFATAEVQDGGILCGEPGVDVHTVNQFQFSYVTNTVVPIGASLSLSIGLYWGYDPLCTPGPNGGLADWAPACIALNTADIEIINLPGSATPVLVGWDVTVDLTGVEVMIPAGSFGYSYHDWVGPWSVNTGPVLVGDNQITAAGAANNFHVWPGGYPQGGVAENLWFGAANWAQFHFQVYSEVACPVNNSGACCVGETCSIAADQAACDGLGGVFSVGLPCSTFFCFAAPANDDCLNAQVITGFGNFAYDNRGASGVGPDPVCAETLGEDVWFSWAAPCTGDVTVSTCLLNLTDDLFAVYQGSNCGDLNTLTACNDDGCGVVGGQSIATFAVTAGTSYLIRMGTWNATAGGENFFDITNVNCSGGPAFCDADWCQDGSVGVPDIFCFLSAWFANDPTARNYGGNPGVPAIFAFLSIWFATGTGPCTP